MKLIEKIEHVIKCDKTIDQQLEYLSQFDNLTEDEKLELTVHHKSSEVGILIEYLGYEKLINHLPNFLEFLQDANWPAAGGAAKMLEKARELIIPEIKRVFKEFWNDDIWHYWILILLIRTWDMELVKTIKPELIELINKVDQEGASIEALKILKEKNLLTEKEVQFYYQYLLTKIKGGGYEIEKELISDLNEIKTSH